MLALLFTVLYAHAESPMMIRFDSGGTNYAAPLVAKLTTNGQSVEVTLSDEGDGADRVKGDGLYAAVSQGGGTKLELELTAGGRSLGKASAAFVDSTAKYDLDITLAGGVLAVKVSAPPDPNGDGGSGEPAQGGGTPLEGGAPTLGGVDIAIKRKSSAVLETDDEITVMAKRVTGAYQPQIDTCARQQINENPAFAGAWRVTFTIGTEGTIFALKIKGLDESNGAFEACIKRYVSCWRFERIAKEFRVAKTYRFALQ